MEAYSYEPLNDGEDEIRLLTIHPAEFNDDIEVSLSTLSYNAAGEQCYEALSYAWGPEDDPARVYVNNGQQDQDTTPEVQLLPGQLLDLGLEAEAIACPGRRTYISVTRNLEAALRRLRFHDKPRVMWIDAISIDQTDLSERGHQVSFMGKIFRCARRVIIWLGPEGDDSNFGMQWIKDRASRVEVDWLEDTVKPSEAALAHDGSSSSSAYRSWKFDKRSSKALYSLFYRSWFERLWVRQEIIVARQAVILCGPLSMPWTDFAAAIYCIQHHNPAVSGVDPSMFERRTQLIYKLIDQKWLRIRLSELRFELIDLKWSDPKDTIYAIKSIRSNWEKGVDINPDYTLSTASLFRIVALNMSLNSFLNFLETCEIESRSLSDLPTWVPDYSQPMKVSRMMRDTWSASAWITAQGHTPAQDENILCVSGIRVATIDKTYHLRHQDEDGQLFRSDDEGFINQVKNLLLWVQSAVSDPDYAYGGSVLDACLRALHAGCTFGDDWEDEGTWSGFSAGYTFEQTRERWKSFLGMTTQMIQGDKRIRWPLEGIFQTMIGRKFVVTSEGYLGVVPRAAKQGDLLAVLLGCRSLIVLRPAPRPQQQGAGLGTEPPQECFQVVGSSMLVGLMAGEAIYGPLPREWRPLRLTDNRQKRSVNGDDIGLKNTRNGRIKSDPEKILSMMGIQASHFQHKPHILEVPPEELERAVRKQGRKLESFMLV